jgi:hypothetical protein
MSEPHKHTCDNCGHAWDCGDPDWMERPLAKCEITKAAKVNGQGPYCILCMDLLGAEAVANSRGELGIANRIQDILALLKTHGQKS